MFKQNSSIHIFVLNSKSSVKRDWWFFSVFFLKKPCANYNFNFLLIWKLQWVFNLFIKFNCSVQFNEVFVVVWFILSRLLSKIVLFKFCWVIRWEKISSMLMIRNEIPVKFKYKFWSSFEIEIILNTFSKLLFHFFV